MRPDRIWKGIAVHIPDGFINGGTSAGAGVVAVGAVGVSLRRAADELDDRRAPLAGLVAAFIFAVQMLNFPVASGTSGHLLGGALAAVLVGPWVAMLCISVVLGVQALVFADGGLSALGLNIVNMAVIGVWVGYLLFVLLRRLLPTGQRSLVIASSVGAGVSVVAAAAGFSVQYAIGGTGSASVGTVTAAMIGVHALIGIGEGIITGLTVGAVLAVRPDLVFGGQVIPMPTTRPAASRAA
jgi:cobalt/nickel transport system permease protein